MTLAKRALMALPFFVAAGLTGVVTDAWPLALAITLPILASCVTGARLDVGVAAGRVIGVLAIASGFVLSTALADALPGAFRVTSAWAGIASAAVLLAGVRLLLRRPSGGFRVTAALGLVAMVACGQTRVGAIYVAGVAAVLVATIVALRTDDAARPAWRAITRRARLTAAAAVLGVVAFTGAAALILPNVRDWVQRRFDLAYTPEDAKIGFSDQMRLGAVRKMLQSDERVIRVYGAKTDYLRGAVYDTYDAPHWTVGRRGPPSAIAETAKGAPPAGERTTEVQRVGGEQERLFVPLAARGFATRIGFVRRDVTGVAYRAAGDPGDSIWFVAGEREGIEVSAPTPADLALPPRLRAQITPLAVEWTKGGATVEAKLRSLERHLESGYTYSLDRLLRNGDPVVDFLYAQKQGHCEYFASALALLARASGIEARVVGGYRVAEWSALGGYWLVRERNAHAWVEAWIPGRGWATFDATPASGLPQNDEHETATLAAIGDLVSVWWRAARAWVLGLSDRPLEMVALLAALILIFVAIGALRRYRRRRSAADDDEASGRALPCLDALLDALAKRGVRREGAETLERFALRVDDAAAAALLARYAAFRYGGIGERASLEREMMAHVRDTLAAS